MSPTTRTFVKPLALLAGALICQGVRAQAAFVTSMHGQMPHDVRMVVEGIGDNVYKNGMRFHGFPVRTNALFESSCVPVVCTPETDGRPFNPQRNHLLPICFPMTCPAVMPPRLRVRLENAGDARQVHCVFELSWTLQKYGDGSAFVQYKIPKARLSAPTAECDVQLAPLQLRLAGGIAVKQDWLVPLQFSINPRPPGSSGSAATH